MWGFLKFMYEALNWTAPNWMALNETLWSQTKACITKSCEVCSIVRYYAAYSGNFLLTFWDNLSVPAWRVKKSKRENGHQQKLTNTIFFFGTLHVICFLKDARRFGHRLFSIFMLRSTWWTLWTELFSMTGHNRNRNLLSYVPENGSSPRVVTRKWISKN